MPVIMTTFRRGATICSGRNRFAFWQGAWSARSTTHHQPILLQRTRNSPLRDFKDTDGWRVAQPKDDALRGKWWEIFNDPQLNALEEKVNVSNQNIASAAASFLAARALVLEARSQLFPTVTTNPAITVQRSSSTYPGGPDSGSGTGTGSASSSRVHLQTTRFPLTPRGSRTCSAVSGTL